MGIDIRLYIGTLVAVLVFFGLGVLVGFGLKREPAAEQLYRRIEAQLRRYREEVARELSERDGQIRDLETRLEMVRHRLHQMEELFHASLPVLVQGRLKGQTVTIVTCAPDWDEGVVEKLKKALRAAGAEVPTVLSLRVDSVLNAGNEVILLLAQQLKVLIEGKEITVLREALLRRLAALLPNEMASEAMGAFVQAGWVRLSGDVTRPITGVVFIGAFRQGRPEEEIRAVDLPFLRGMVSVGIPFVACETTPTEPSVVSFYREDNFATVDHLETPEGLLSVIAILSGRPDHYGFKRRAKRPFPDFTQWVPDRGSP